MLRVAALAVLLLAGCPRDAPDRLIVLAPSSLAAPFERLARHVEAAHPGAEVQLVLAGTQTLRVQLEHGAPADVFASADREQMQRLVDQGLVGRPQRFACNALVLIVPRANPAGVRSPADLATVPRVVLAAPEVPAGRYAEQWLASQGAAFAAAVTARVVSRELNVRQVLTKVRLGEAHAGLVYRTDALAARDEVRWFELPDAPRVEYAIAQVTDREANTLSAEWLKTVATQRATFESHGFTDCAPPSSR